MADSLWKRIEIGTLEHPPFRLTPDDECYYARDYLVNRGFSASEANNLIKNFKKDPSKRNSIEWRYKVQAIERFARELNSVIPNGMAACAIPTSKRRDDPDYDDRLDRTLQSLHRLNPTITVERPFERHVTIQSMHSGGQRKVKVLYDSLLWLGFSAVPKCLILVDDMITCGTSFRACSQHIHEHHPDLRVIGLFWARAVWPDDQASQVDPK